MNKLLKFKEKNKLTRSLKEGYQIIKKTDIGLKTIDIKKRSRIVTKVQKSLDKKIESLKQNEQNTLEIPNVDKNLLLSAVNFNKN